MQRISRLSKQLCRQESAYTKVKEQKTKEKLFCSVRKLIALLRFPRQEVLRSGSRILEETVKAEGSRRCQTDAGYVETRHQMPAPMSMATRALGKPVTICLPGEGVCVFPLGLGDMNEV